MMGLREVLDDPLGMYLSAYSGKWEYIDPKRAQAELLRLADEALVRSGHEMIPDPED